MKTTTTLALSIALTGLSLISDRAPAAPPSAHHSDVGGAVNHHPVHHRTVSIDGLDLFYRESGPKDAPTLLLLHGFPTSSHMFRDLIPMLSDKYHVVAPDYPGYGNSSMPSVDQFEYTFDHLAVVVEKFTERLQLDRYSLYVMDYGAPVGFRLATKHPERVQSLIVQNGNAYLEGIENDFWEPIRHFWKNPDVVDQGLDNPFWAPVKKSLGGSQVPVKQALGFLVSRDATRWQYTHGVRDTSQVSPDAWDHAQARLDRPGNGDIQARLLFDYGSNPPRYPEWQAYLREHQPPTLIVWGKNDAIFPAAGALPYQRDLKEVELHLLDTGHFALEDKAAEIAEKIRSFLPRHGIR